ncbi:MAG: hypothetical protein K2L42_01535 [Clostridia bacterium]|nr:hypothetical protein [Clostridia bacterium]
MKAPYYDLKHHENSEEVSEHILNYIQPVHYFRRRNALYGCSLTCNPEGGKTRWAAMKGVMPDSRVRSYFERDLNKRKICKNLLGGKHVGAFVAVFLILINVLFGILCCHLIKGNIDFSKADQISVLILLIITTVLFTAILAFFGFRIVRLVSYVNRVYKKLDDLYVIPAADGNPCCIVVESGICRVLHGSTLSVIKNGSVETTSDPLEVYLAYLEMYPQSALDMDKFVGERKKEFLSYDGGNGAYNFVDVYSSFHSAGAWLSVNAAKNTSIAGIHKILLELDNEFRVKAVYLAAGRNYANFITRAEALERGESVLNEIQTLRKSNPELDKILGKVL